MKRKWKPIPMAEGAIGVETAPLMVHGRDEFVEQLWDKILSGASLNVLAERRMGKTWALWLAVARQPENVVAVFFDVEKTKSVEEFVIELNRFLHKKGFITSTYIKKVEIWYKGLVLNIQGQDIGKIKLPDDVVSWSKILEDTLTKFAESCEGKIAMLILDEISLLLDKISKNQGSDLASDLLDKLRAHRQTIPKLQMIFCGSLGLHIVLKKLKADGYTGSPINDLIPVDVEPLSEPDSLSLAAGLLSGEIIKCDDLDAVSEAISKTSSRVPFYIKNLIRWIKDHLSEPITPANIPTVLQQLFDTPGDPVQFNYYNERMDQYYTKNEAQNARVILDILSRTGDGIDFNELLNRIRHREETLEFSKDELLGQLQLLKDDHYLVKAGDKWIFKLDIVRKWWFEYRGGLNL